MKFIKILIEEDNSDSNKTKEGIFIRSKEVAKVFFEDSFNETIICNKWAFKAEHIVEMLKALKELEIKKYPFGKYKENLLFIQEIYPIYKEYLDKNGLRIPQEDLDFVENISKINQEKKRLEYENRKLTTNI